MIAKTLSLATLLALSSACTSSNDEPPDTGEDPGSGSDAAPNLPAGISVLAGTDAELPPTDLAAFDALVGSATYIGLGEAVHTSGGFYAMKRRLIEHLVRDSGLRVLAMETPRTDALKLDAYLTTSCGNSMLALRSIFPVFVDDNTQGLFEWLCGWNMAHPTDRVRFFGFDAQQPGQDLGQLDAFLTQYMSAKRDSLIAGLSTCHKVQPSSQTFPPYPDADYVSCYTALDAIDEELASQRAALVTAAGEESVRLAEIASLSFRSWQGQDHFWNDNIAASYEARDVAMHEIFAALRDLYFPHERVILWAHNYHLMRHHSETDDQTAPARTFGEDLAAEVGDAAYAPIGFTGRDVHYNWPGVPGTDLGPVSSPSFTQRLVDLAQPFLLVDTKATWVGTAPEVMRDSVEGPIVVARQYAGMIYFDTSPGMNALFW